MRWGFGWELGPFEIADAIGIERVLEVAREVSPNCSSAASLELCGSNARRKAPPAPELQILRDAKDRSKHRQEERGASLVDIGDGVLAIEFHSKMNAIGADTLQMLQAGVREAEQNFAALVVGNDAPHFSAGANLMLLLLEAQEENWDDIDLIIRQFQQIDDGTAVRGGAGHRRTGRARPRRRLRGLRSTPIACRQPARPTWGWSKSASASFPRAPARKRWSRGPPNRWRREAPTFCRRFSVHSS